MALENVTFHLEVTVLGLQMNLGCKHHLYVLFLLGESSSGSRHDFLLSLSHSLHQSIYWEQDLYATNTLLGWVGLFSFMWRKAQSPISKAY